MEEANLLGQEAAMSKVLSYTDPGGQVMLASAMV